MHEVRPGQVVRVNRNGLTKRRYWMLTAREHEDDLPRTIRTVTELLEDTVRRQIVADVPLCSLLSGGHDPKAATRRRSPGLPPPVAPLTARKFLMPIFWSG
jgi:asparagine synthase (glutamine-hydrolysing)